MCDLVFVRIFHPYIDHHQSGPSFIYFYQYDLCFMIYDLFSYVRSLNERRIKQLTRNIYFGKNFFYLYSQYFGCAARQ